MSLCVSISIQTIGQSIPLNTGTTDETFPVWKTRFFQIHIEESAFLSQIFLCQQKIADMNGDIFRSRWQMCKSRQQIYFLLIAHYQLTFL